MSIDHHIKTTEITTWFTRDFTKTQILAEWNWGGALDSAVPTPSGSADCVAYPWATIGEVWAQKWAKAWKPDSGGENTVFLQQTEY